MKKNLIFTPKITTCKNILTMGTNRLYVYLVLNLSKHNYALTPLPVIYDFFYLQAWLQLTDPVDLLLFWRRWITPDFVVNVYFCNLHNIHLHFWTSSKKVTKFKNAVAILLIPLFNKPYILWSYLKTAGNFGWNITTF